MVRSDPDLREPLGNPPRVVEARRRRAVQVGVVTRGGAWRGSCVVPWSMRRGTAGWGNGAVIGAVMASALGSTPTLAAAAGTLVIELDGGDVILGPDDAAQRSTPIAQMVGAFAPYGSDPERREALLQAVRADWSAYDVAVTSTPPAQGDFTMVMVGPSNPFGAAITGIATLDCDDAAGARSLAFAFYSADDGVPANVAATTISQEAAHGLGLEHVDGPGDIMLPVQAEGDSSFTDGCLPISGPVECGAQHLVECGSVELQNAHAELLRRFGPSEPDTLPPAVAITVPSDGFEIAEGEPVSVSVEASDDKGLAEATLYIDGVGSSTDPDVPYGWEIAELPAGDYEIYVVVADLGGNLGTSDVIDLHVLRGEGSLDDDGGDEDGDPSGGGIPLPPPPPPSQPTSGCALAVPPSTSRWSWLLLLPLARRRRQAWSPTAVATPSSGAGSWAGRDASSSGW